MKANPVSSSFSSNRKSGILLHPTSFPGPFGIGDLGAGAYRFIDFLYDTQQSLWQVLPLGPTGFGDSPYQSFSSFAGQPLIISIEKLVELQLLQEPEIEYRPWNAECIDYGPLIEYKNALLRQAFAHFNELADDTGLKAEFEKFCKSEKSWLADYSLFMAAKDYHDGRIWTTWADDIAFPTKSSKKKWLELLQSEVIYYKFIQFLFFKQWFELKQYANQKGISIIGDIPIFVAFDSADVWANKELFYLQKDGYPTIVAGVPPDYFSETGQLWGNPLYDWAAHDDTDYKWWIKRIKNNLTLVDFLRIDHFRGFEAYWAIPYGAETAINGEWQQGPNRKLFLALEAALGHNLPIIAEDLGVITPSVEKLRDEFCFPGMKILQFAFEDIEDNAFLPHNFIPNTVCYTGTHDNDTTYGWYHKAEPINQDKVRRYMNTDGMDICWDFIRTCFGSVSQMAVVPLQDLLSYDSWARTNTPGVAAGNWQWRYQEYVLDDYLKERLTAITLLYGRSHSNQTLSQTT